MSKNRNQTMLTRCLAAAALSFALNQQKRVGFDDRVITESTCGGASVPLSSLCFFLQVVHLDKEEEMQKLPLQPPYYDMAPSESTPFTDKPVSSDAPSRFTP